MDNIRTKVRALVEDFGASSFELYEYEDSNIFTVSEPNVDEITMVLRNGGLLEESEWSFDSTTNKLTVTLASGSEFASGDKVEIDFTYNKYSDSELTKYITAGIVWLSIFSYGENNYEVYTASDIIRPNPDAKTVDLISIVTSILIKPNYSEYRLANRTVKYPRTMTRDEKIQKIISRFQMGLGINDIVTYISE